MDILLGWNKNLKRREARGATRAFPSVFGSCRYKNNKVN